MNVPVHESKVTNAQSGVEPQACFEAASVDPIEAPYMAIDDSPVQNGLRPAAVGRKNGLNPASDQGGRTEAVFHS
jgi:hypothetical protein